MSDLVEVAVSAAVGKQVFAAGVAKKLISVVVTAVSACAVTVRSGNASGDVKLTALAEKGVSRQFKFKPVRFDDGMHVKVIGTNSRAYLEIE